MYPESGQLRKRDFKKIYSDDDLGLQGLFVSNTIERSGSVLDGLDIGLGDEAGPMALMGNKHNLRISP